MPNSSYLSKIFFEFIVYALPLIVAIVLHEISHAVVAYALGDDTAKRAGRFKLHTHFDLFGSFIIPLALYMFKSPFLIGYAKPVPINPKKFSNARLDMAIVAAAGPLCNAILAVGGVLLFRSFIFTTMPLMQQLIVNFIIINLVLFFFNLIPIPPLDGSRILAAFLPASMVRKFYSLESLGFVIIIAIEMISRRISGVTGCPSMFNLLIGNPIRKTIVALLG